MSMGLEVADVFRHHGDAYRRARAEHLGRIERRVMSAILACRTAALGGHVEACEDCGATRIAYNSCRNRHCPKCQGLARAHWLAARQAELLPVPYFHVVFTLPPAAAEIAFQNKAGVYAILMRTAAETLVTIAACRNGFFLPVRVLSRLFRRLFLAGLRNAFETDSLVFCGDLAKLGQPAAFARRLDALRRLDWVVYAKPPFGGPKQVLAYLGRYTHRVAIANSRGDACLSCLSLTRFRGAIATSSNGMMTCLAAVIAFSYLSRRTKGLVPMSKQVLTRLWSECTLPAWMPCPYIPARRALRELALSYARTMLYYF